MKKAIKNGIIIKEEDATISVLDRGMQYAYSVYESLKIKNGAFVHLEEHLERLKESMNGLGMRVSFSVDDIRESLLLLSREEKLVDQTFRILVVGGYPGSYFITHSENFCYPESYYTEGVEVTTYKGERFLPAYKSSNLLVSYLALEEARSRGGFEALLVNRKGYVTEGTRSNFYAIKGDTIYTASDDDVLHGVTRIGLVESAGRLGMKVVYEPVYPEKFQSYDSLFITSTSMKAIPVKGIDGVPVPRRAHDKVLELSRLIGEWE